MNDIPSASHSASILNDLLVRQQRLMDSHAVIYYGYLQSKIDFDIDVKGQIMSKILLKRKFHLSNEI